MTEKQGEGVARTGDLPRPGVAGPPGHERWKGWGATSRSRRAVLRAAAGATGAAALAGRAGSAGASQATPTGSPAPVAGMLPSPAPGVPDAYEASPPVFQSVAEAPGTGGEVTTFQISYSPPIPPREENQYWQELERRLNVGLRPALAPADTYDDQLAVVTASGELPDLVTLLGGPAVIQAIQQGAYTDLTDYLSDEALQEYPNLAGFLPEIWENVRIDGRIYGVPRPRPIPGFILVFRQDWAERFGVERPQNADEFRRLMGSFTTGDPDGNGQADSWGLGGVFTNLSLGFMFEMFRVPNGWRPNDDGTLTSAIETEEYKAALGFARQLWADGVYHPDTLGMTPTTAKGLFATGRIGGWWDGLLALPDVGDGSVGIVARTKERTPTANVIALVPPGHDGGSGTTHRGSGLFGFTAIASRVGDEERVRELLRVLDYYAAPFGSEERVFLDYGLEGVHHTLEPDGSRVLTDRGSLELGDLSSPTNGPQVYYYPGAPGLAAYMQELTRDMLAIAVDNPVRGLFSPTEAEEGGTLSDLVTDRVTGIVTGREPLESLDQMLEDWRNRGGDRIREDYQEALASG